MDIIDGFSNFFSNLEDVRMSMVLKERDAEVKVSVRVADDNLSALPLVKLFKGGGHKKAAGFTIKGKLEQTGDYWQIT